MAARIKKALAVCLLIGFLIAPLAAYADSYVQGFAYDGGLRAGEIVAFGDSKRTKVKAAPAINSSLIYGVVVSPGDAALTLNREGRQVFVATNGSFPVLVSDEQGAVAVGDYISMSSVDGVAAKATSDQPVLVGRAAAAFNSGTIVSRSSDKTVRKLLVNVSVVRNPDFKNSVAIPAPLRKVGNAIAGQEVSPFKIYAALVIFLAAVSVTTVLLMVGVRSGLTAIGRNPLSQHSIMGGLFQVIAASLGVFMAGLFAVYLLLRL